MLSQTNYLWCVNELMAQREGMTLRGSEMTLKSFLRAEIVDHDFHTGFAKFPVYAFWTLFNVFSIWISKLELEPQVFPLWTDPAMETHSSQRCGRWVFVDWRYFWRSAFLRLFQSVLRVKSPISRFKWWQRLNVKGEFGITKVNVRIRHR